MDRTGLNNVLRMSVTSLVYLSSPCAKHSCKVQFLHLRPFYLQPSVKLIFLNANEREIRNATHGKKCYVIQGSMKMFLTVPSRFFIVLMQIVSKFAER